MTDPRFPNRPEHPDFWLISEVLVSGDAAQDNETIPFEDHVNQVVDANSLDYMAQQQAGMFLQRAGRTSASGERLLAMIQATWMTAFQYGIRFAELRRRKSAGQEQEPGLTVEGALLEDIATGTLDAPPLPPVRKQFLLDDAEHIITLCQSVAAEEIEDITNPEGRIDAAVELAERTEVFARRVAEYLTKEASDG